MEVKFELRGAAEMERLLLELGRVPARRAGRRALNRAARGIVDLAKQKIEAVGAVLTGELKDSITTQAGRNRDGELTQIIGFRRPTSRRAHFPEFGTVHSAATPFMRPALDEGAEQAFDEMGEELTAGIEAEAARIGRR